MAAPGRAPASYSRPAPRRWLLTVRQRNPSARRVTAGVAIPTRASPSRSNAKTGSVWPTPAIRARCCDHSAATWSAPRPGAPGAGHLGAAWHPNTSKGLPRPRRHRPPRGDADAAADAQVDIKPVVIAGLPRRCPNLGLGALTQVQPWPSLHRGRNLCTVGELRHAAAPRRESSNRSGLCHFGVCMRDHHLWQ